MSLKNSLRKIVLCITLQAGLIMGVPMRPEEIEELMRCMSQPEIVRTIPEESDAGGDLN
jgi:hypothetical protein